MSGDHLVTGAAIRRIILDQSMRAHVGHIGSALCIADLVAALYGSILRVASPDDPDRDRFILAKGHAALALYAALYLRGWVSLGELNTFCGDGTVLGVHPEHIARGIDFSTGSLGQGLSIGAGAALAARMQRSTRRAFVLMSDAECNEGSVWEAAAFAAHHQLGNLISIVDLNRQQALGYTDDVLRMSPLADRWRAFGWHVREVDGHDVAAIKAAGECPSAGGTAPTMVIAHTTFGKGVSFMEGQIKWHYLPLSAELYQQARAEVEAAG
jgi:transketolase